MTRAKDGSRRGCYQKSAEHRAKIANTLLAKRVDRFWAQVAKQPGCNACWLWTGHIEPNGYGRFGGGGRSCFRTSPHRFSYELAHGPIPDGLVIDHLCRVPNCVNPGHLDAVPTCVNVQRGKGAKLNHVAARVIRYLHQKGFSLSRLARAYKIDPSTVWSAARGETWQHAR
jgi:hypothetical protein